MKCDFCDDGGVNRRIVIEDKLAFAFPTYTPIVPGHMIVCPKRHVQYYEDLLSKEKAAIEKLRVKLKAALTKVFHAEGFNYAWNEEKIGGQSVPHFHLHIVPRKKGDAGIHRYEPAQFLYRPGARDISPEEELLQVAEALKAAL